MSAVVAINPPQPPGAGRSLRLPKELDTFTNPLFGPIFAQVGPQGFAAMPIPPLSRVPLALDRKGTTWPAAQLQRRGAEPVFQTPPPRLSLRSAGWAYKKHCTVSEILQKK